MNNTRRSRGHGSLMVALCAAAISVLALAANPASAQCQYEVTAIIVDDADCWPLPDSNVFGRGMNARGDVVGYYVPCAIGNERAFFWSEKTGFVTLPTPPGVVQAMANDINDAGLIVGGHVLQKIGWKGFVYRPDTNEYTYLEPLHDWPDPLYSLSSLNAINNAGIAVGSRVISKPGVSPTVSNAVIWDTNTGEVIDLSVMQGTNSGAMDISESGDFVVGWANGSGFLFGQAVIWTNEKPQVIGPLPGTDYSIVNAVNESGVAAGSGRIQSPAAFHAFLWDGSYTTAEPIKPWQAARCTAINNLGQAVLYFSHLSQGHVPLLWQHNELYYLNSLLAPRDSKITLSVATDTNNHGQILCATTINFAVVLTPADRPLTDLNADCRTGVDDLLMLLDAWSSRVARNSKAAADLNGDGIVDVSDLLILLANWSQ